MEEADSPWLQIDVDALRRVTEPEQAAIIVDPTRSQFLRPFLGCETTVSEAAAAIGCSPNAMLYRVRRMLGVGLLNVIREVPRAGRAVKIYRSSHDGYLVPMDAMRYDDLRHRVATQGRTLTRQLTDAYTDVLTRSTDGARVLARNNDGDIWATDLLPTVNHRGQPVYLGDGTVWLTQGEAEHVRRLLAAAFNHALDAARHADEHTRRQPYLVLGGLLPSRD